MFRCFFNVYFYSLNSQRVSRARIQYSVAGYTPQVWLNFLAFYYTTGNFARNTIMTMVEANFLQLSKVLHVLTFPCSFLFQRASNEYFDMVIFMTFFILVSIICFILLLKVGGILTFKTKIFNQIWIVASPSSMLDKYLFAYLSLRMFDWSSLLLCEIANDESSLK